MALYLEVEDCVHCLIICCLSFTLPSCLTPITSQRVGVSSTYHVAVCVCYCAGGSCFPLQYFSQGALLVCSTIYNTAVLPEARWLVNSCMVVPDQ